jgi:hypothetical protein
MIGDGSWKTEGYYDLAYKYSPMNSISSLTSSRMKNINGLFAINSIGSSDMKRPQSYFTAKVYDLHFNVAF